MSFVVAPLRYIFHYLFPCQTLHDVELGTTEPNETLWPMEFVYELIQRILPPGPPIQLRSYKEKYLLLALFLMVSFGLS